MNDWNFEGLARELLSRSRELVPMWLPGGKLIGKEWTCGNLRGEPGESMRVNIDTGKWADFSGTEKGGDLISLYAAIEGIKNGEAAKRLAEENGFELRENIPQVRPSEPAAEEPPPDDVDLVKPPEDAEVPEMNHPSYGSPSAAWCYPDFDGSTMFYIARYDTETGKEIVPWSWSQSEQRWVMKGWPAPRPLYGLQELAENPGKPVLIVEGEKAADAAKVIVEGKYAVVTWPNGSKAYGKADWRPLAGRNVLIWPDADRKVEKNEGRKVPVGQVLPYEDQPGAMAAAGIAKILDPHCPQVKLINVGLDESLPDGWDARDALDDGWNWESLKSWASSRVTVWGAKAVAAAKSGNATAAATASVTVNVQSGDKDMVDMSIYALWEKFGVVLTGQGQPICNEDNVLRVLDQMPQLTGVVWYDEFHGKHFTVRGSEKPREWSDLDTLKIMTFLQRQLGFVRISDSTVYKALMVYADRTIKNEPRDWMDTLKWDGQERIEDFFINCFGAEESDYTRSASRNWWVSMAARIYSPGCQVDNMLILEGAQGKYKSSALNIIGSPWYAEAQESPTSKDFYMALHGKLIVEVGEMDSFRRAEETLIKRLLSSRSDRFRPPYGRASVDFKRRCVFVGTTNEDTYLKDHTGGRRFWPIKIENIDLPAIRRDREQLFAEAVHYFKAGLDCQACADDKDKRCELHSWWRMPGDETLAAQEGRRQADEWEYIILDWLRSNQKTQVTIHELAAEALKIDMSRFDMLLQRRIGKILTLLRWRKFFIASPGSDHQRKVWRAPDYYEEDLPF